jgi:F-type H+-transporting ATPase subunit delta
MKIGKLSRREAKQLFRSTFVNGAMDHGRVRLAVTAIISKKPRGYVAILNHFQRLLKLEEARRLAKVESAATLGSDQQASVRNELARTYGPGLNVVFSENPALLGGLRIQVGSDVYDGSVQARLAQLEESF